MWNPLQLRMPADTLYERVTQYASLAQDFLQHGGCPDELTSVISRKPPLGGVTLRTVTV